MSRLATTIRLSAGAFTRIRHLSVEAEGEFLAAAVHVAESDDGGRQMKGESDADRKHEIPVCCDSSRSGTADETGKVPVTLRASENPDPLMTLRSPTVTPTQQSICALENPDCRPILITTPAASGFCSSPYVSVRIATAPSRSIGVTIDRIDKVFTLSRADESAQSIIETVRQQTDEDFSGHRV